MRVADKAFCEPPLLMSSIIHTEGVNMEHGLGALDVLPDLSKSLSVRFLPIFTRNHVRSKVTVRAEKFGIAVRPARIHASE